MSIAKTVEDYISRHPSVKDCLKDDLVNFSSLSRRIADECSLSAKNDFDAILIACRRFQRKLRQSDSSEKKIISILKKSKIEVKNKICVLVCEKDVHSSVFESIEKELKRKGETFRLIEGASAITLICSEDFYDFITKQLRNKLISENDKLAEIIIKSPPEIESVPGAYAYLCSTLGENGINIVETLSCWTDTIFVVDEKDVGKIITMLRF
jgi:aspartokinase